MRIALFVALALALSTPAFAAELTPQTERARAAKLRLKDIDGKRFDLKALKGRVVVVNFWATWCAPCMQELPFLDAMHQKLEKKGLTVLAISNDGPETSARIRTVVKQRKFKMPILHDKSGQVMASHNPRGGNPYTIFIDKEGRVAYAHEGYAPGDEKGYEALVTALLSE